ncbi:MAG TPA: dockerin type I domain-containing protein, partial [Pirellulales bacterium]|jgi:hypothetical protein|nr:dockerin type I domain-containing protein [Pirellulales bacterium]
LVAPQTGVPLFSALGDINGFAHTTLTSSPSAGAIAATIANGGLGTLNSVDFAQNNPNFEVVVGSTGSHEGAYTTNDGVTWTEFASRPNNNASGGAVAVSADGSTILWAASGKLPFFSTNNGSTWTAATMPSGTLTGGTVVSDRVNSSVFYYWTENSSDNQWKLYISTNGGHSFTQTGSALSNGNITLVANPLTAGDLWISSYNGVYHSTNSGTSFTQVSSIGFANVPSMTLGAPPPGKTYPAIYIYGTINNFLGVYRSDDAGQTWILLNDVNHQWGGLVDTMAADPNVFGRVYLGINGRGVIVGNPASSLPSGWVDADINMPGNPGWASSSTTLSTGATVNLWTVVGGGAGIGDSSDQFNFAYQPISGDVAITAEILSMTNADGTHGTPASGVMFRAGTSSNDPFAALLQSDGNSLVFEYRTTSGGSITSVPLGSIPVGSEYVRVVRVGNNFSGFYSSDGVTWTQLGSTIAIAAMPTSADVGLAAAANYNPQLTSAIFTNVAILLRGDINLDGHRDAADIVALINALVGLNTYQMTRQLSSQDLLNVADINNDGHVNNLDVQALINLLLGGGGSVSTESTTASSTDGLFGDLNPTPPTLLTSTPSATDFLTSNNNNTPRQKIPIEAPAKPHGQIEFSLPGVQATKGFSGLSLLSSVRTSQPISQMALDQFYGTFEPEDSLALAPTSSRITHPQDDFDLLESFWAHRGLNLQFNLDGQVTKVAAWATRDAQAAEGKVFLDVTVIAWVFPPERHWGLHLHGCPLH